MHESGNSEPISHNEKINAFFNSQYNWWGEVYDQSLPRKFLSFEMIKRKQLLIDLLNKYSAKGKTTQILECGCGPGGIIKELGPLKCQLTGVDINSRHLERAREDIDEHVGWVQSDVENLPFRDGSFDLVYCVGVLSYLRDDTKAISEMARVLKDGGVVIISVPNMLMLNKLLDPYYYLAWSLKKFINKIKISTHITSKNETIFESGKIRRYWYSRINEKFEKCGMKEVETVNVSFGPLTLWRNEVLSLKMSMNISECLRRVGEKKGFHFLWYFTNHWITCLSKSNI